MKKISTKRNPSRFFIILMLLASFFSIEAALAHGERNQEPFLRMRTLHWYDTNFSVKDHAVLQVNDIVTITGKFRIFSKWPKQIPEPHRMYLNVNSSGATFVKLESWINGKAAIQSFEGELGRDYEYKIVLKARWPGAWHVHPMINVKDAGGLAGPGLFIDVEGDYHDFEMAGTTIDGTKIDDLSTFGMARVYGWNIFWGIVGVAWLIYWIAKPLLIPRFLMVKNGEYNEKLVTPKDKKVSLMFLIVTVVVTIGGAILTSKQFPNTVTLQAGVANIKPSPIPEGSVVTNLLRGEYYIPGRTFISKLAVTNNTKNPVRLGEFTSANLRFINNDFSILADEKAAGMNNPLDLIAKTGLQISDDTPIAPGATKEFTIEATDAAWEVERLDSMLNNPESTFGALLSFFDDQGNRHLSELFGNAMPVFKKDVPEGYRE